MIELRAITLSWLTSFLALACTQIISTQFSALALMQNLVFASCFFGGALAESKEEQSSLRQSWLFLLTLLLLLLLVRVLGLRNLALAPDFAIDLPGQFTLPVPLLHDVASSGITLVIFSLLIGLFRALGSALLQAGSAQGWRSASLYLVLGALGAAICWPILCRLSCPPAAWFSVAALGFACLLRARVWRLVVPCSVVLASTLFGLPLSGNQTLPSQVFSPYAELQTLKDLSGKAFAVMSNGCLSQIALSQGAPDRAPSVTAKPLRPSFYQLAPALVPDAKKVLVIGSGTGNDVAALQRIRDVSVDAVELDPQILALGRFHPDAPYEKKGVRTFAQEGREFLRSNTKAYDLIIVSRLVSASAISPLLPVRASELMLTSDALRKLKSRLADGGHLMVALSWTPAWLPLKIASNLYQATRGKPECLHREDGEVLVYPPGEKIIGSQLAETLDSASFGAAFAHGAEPNDDDRPFVSSLTRAIPLPHLWGGYILTGVLLLFCRPKWAVVGLSKIAQPLIQRLFAFTWTMTLALFLSWLAANLCVRGAGIQVTWMIYQLAAICFLAALLTLRRVLPLWLPAIAFYLSLMAAWQSWSDLQLLLACASVLMVSWAVLLCRWCTGRPDKPCLLKACLAGFGSGLMLVNIAFMTGFPGLFALAAIASGVALILSSRNLPGIAR